MCTVLYLLSPENKQWKVGNIYMCYGLHCYMDNKLLEAYTRKKKS